MPRGRSMTTRPDARSAEVAVERLAQADRALAAAIDIADAAQLVATGKALREWASAVHAGKEHERQAAVFVLRAQRNAGERIAEAQARGEVARPGDAGRAKVAGVDFGKAELAELGVTRDESSDWQRLADAYPTDADLKEAAEQMPRPSLAGALRSRSKAMPTKRRRPDRLVLRDLLDAAHEVYQIPGAELRAVARQQDAAELRSVAAVLTSVADVIETVDRPAPLRAVK